MLDPKTAEYPQIMNVHQPPHKLELTGIEITDAAPIGDALLALGVPESEIASWQIFTGRPGSKPGRQPGAKQMYINPVLIDRQMHSASILGSEAGRKWRFVESFKDVAPLMILTSMAVHLAVREKQQPSHWYAVRRHAGNLGTGALAILTYDSLEYLHPNDFTVSALAAAAVGASVGYLRHAVDSPKRLAKKKVVQAKLAQPDLLPRIGKVIRPIYYPQ